MPEELAGARLDRSLARQLGLPRNQIQNWIESGLVRIDDTVVGKTGRALKPGETLSWEAPLPADDRITPESGELRLIHLDEDLIVLDKPPGLAMHPGAGRSAATLAHRLLGRFPELAGVGGPGRPGIVHRLDKDTSGVLVVARHADSYRTLSRAFAERRVEKRYLAIVRGAPRAATGSIDLPIGRHAVKRQKMAVRADGRQALTLFRVVAKAPAWSLLELDLKTGRTHQIRVHLQHLGYPVAGDTTYGGGAPGSSAATRKPLPPRVALHAWRLAFSHPRDGRRVEFEAPFASDLAEWWSRVGGESTPAIRSGDGAA